MIKLSWLYRGAALLATAVAPVAVAQVQPAANSFPQALPVARAVPEPVDTAYPGTITLDIAVNDLATGAEQITETVPVEPGAGQLTLLLPEWIPGHHNRGGLAAELTGIHFTSDGKELTWHRDPVDTLAYVIDVPAGAHDVVARMIHTPALHAEPGDRVTVTREIVDLQWNEMTLYPAGHYVRRIMVKPSLTLPAGFDAFSALDGKAQTANRFAWNVTDYETLVDSPVFAGRYARRLPIGDGVAIDAVADKEADLAIKPEHLETYRNLVREADALFGARHFDHYDFLLGLTDRLTGIGLEHHRSSENTYAPNVWTDWPETDWQRNVIAHEFVHSWNGKFRRPADLWTPDYHQPMIDDLLWVYEGQTQFWGLVLAARSGVQAKATILGALADYAGAYSVMAGRDWRSVEDTTFDPVFAARRPKPFPTMSRGEDYYAEAALIWLEADQIIRNGTAGKRGLDDFARAFFGGHNGDWGVVTYTRADVEQTLNSIYVYDWKAFFNARIDRAGQPVPLGGIERGGYRLVWKAEPNAVDLARMLDANELDLGYSLGMTLDHTGNVTATRWGTPAFTAGIVPGVQVIAVNGDGYDAKSLKAAITDAKGSDKPIALLVKRDNHYDTISISYHDGLRYPWLDREPGAKGPGGLDILLSPHRNGAGR